MTRVIPPHRRDPDDSHDSQYYRRGVDDIRNVITSTTEPLNAEPGTLWYNPEGVPDYGVDIGISKDDADSLYTSKAEFAAVADVPPRVEAVETQVARIQDGMIVATSYPGVDPTGAANSGAGLQAFLDDLSSTRRAGVIPPGTYRIDRRLDIGSNTSLSMHGAVFEQYNTALGSGAVTEGVFHIVNAHHVTLHGGAIDGRKGHIAGATEYKHGVSIIGDCDHITIRDMVSNQNKGDGFYVGRSKLDAVPYPVPRNISIERCIADGNHRQGMSITHGRDISVSDSAFVNTSGTAPQAGLDIEVNNGDETISNLTFTRCRFEGNATSGAIVMGIYHRTALQKGITFRDCIFARNTQHGVYVQSGEDVVFEGCRAEENVQTGVIISRDVRNLRYVGGRIVNNTTMGVSINPVETTALLEDLIFDGVTIQRNSRGISVSQSNGVVDGVTVRRCTIGDPFASERQDRGIRTFVSGGTCSNVTVEGNTFGNATVRAAEFGGDNAATRIVRDNKGYVTEGRGTNSVADGDTIAHGLAVTPAFVSVAPTVAGRNATVTAITATTFTVSLTDLSGTPITTAETVRWRAEA